MWFLHKPRCATLRLLPRVDVNRASSWELFFQDLAFASFQKVRIGMETVWTLCCPRTRLVVLRTQTSPEYC